jgi:phytoene desaturase
MSKISVIGAGFSGLSAAAYLSAAGHEVTIYEKNAMAGGRARQFKTNNGYTFDMGPSWYWMPDLFEQFFNDFGYSPSDFYDLRQLDPAFEMIFADESISIPSDFSELCRLFESIEKESSGQFKKFMRQAEYKYHRGMKELAHKPGLSLSEFADAHLIKDAMRLDVFSTFSKHVRNYFSHPKLIALMEFPVLFLGAMPSETPALYSLMNYAGLKLGTWYPKGGFGKVVEAMKQVAEENGAVFHFNAPVEKISTKDDRVNGVIVSNENFECDAIVATADYHHVENKLLPAPFRNYDESYWQKKTFAPSCLIYYLGISKKIVSLKHHTLFFDEDLLRHSKEIYKNQQWPGKPCFYVCSPSQTDESTAPKGHENLFMLMPLAPGLEDNEELREKYFNIMMQRLEKHIGADITPYIDFKQNYCINDFVSDYHSYKGNAYGLANTLSQTAVMKPKIRNKKLGNLFYAGQLTVPGPGVPPALISGKIASKQVFKYLNSRKNEAVI